MRKASLRRGLHLSASRLLALASCILGLGGLTTTLAEAGELPTATPAGPAADFDSFIAFERGRVPRPALKCGARDGYVASLSQQKRLEAEIQRLRSRARAASPQEGPRLLNGSGYNYLPGR